MPLPARLFTLEQPTGWLFLSQQPVVDLRAGGVAGLDVRVSTGLVIEGTISRADNGQPVASATVVALTGQATAGIATSDSQGTFRIKSLIPRTYTLAVDGARLAPLWLETNLTKSTTINLTMDLGSTIQGKLVLSDGSSPTNAIIAVKLL